MACASTRRLRLVPRRPAFASVFGQTLHEALPACVVRLEFCGAVGGRYRIIDPACALARFGDERPIGCRRGQLGRTTSGDCGLDRIAPIREQHLGEGCMNRRFVLAPCDQPTMQSFRFVDRSQPCQAGCHRQGVHHIVLANLGRLPKCGKRKRRRPLPLMDLGEEQSTRWLGIRQVPRPMQESNSSIGICVGKADAGRIHVGPSARLGEVPVIVCCGECRTVALLLCPLQ